MKLLLLVLFFAAVACALETDTNFYPRHGIPPAKPPKTRTATPTWGIITQKVDNFDPTNTKTWQMRYIENGQFYKPGGPVFIMLGAEWVIDEGWLLSSQMFDMAKIHNAYMYYTEHRYYGESNPTSDLSTANLKYLTVDQALADAAYFISKVKEISGMENSKVIVFGGSYGATMATWMRQKYPHLVHGAVASSAPLLAKVDFKEYHEVVQNSLGSKCASIFTNAAKEIRRLIDSGNKAKVERDFTLCWPMQSDMDVQTLFQYLSSRIDGKVQYADANTIANECNFLSNPNLASDYDKLAAYSNDGYCKGNYDYMIQFMKNTSLHNGIGRQWFYQTCTNFGFFQTAWGENSLLYYGIPVNFYQQQCTDIFGPTFTPQVTAMNVEETNKEHGALNPAVTRVISVHGTVDPWHALGATTDINAKSPSYLVKDAAHCKDMFSLNIWETYDMYYAKQAVVDNVAKWLEEPY